MKQYITVEQFKELDIEQKEKIKKIINLKERNDILLWCNGEEKYPGEVWCWEGEKIPLLSIGQMIEFLDFDLKEMINEGTGWKINLDDCLLDKKENFPTNCIVLSELCDILWIAVKDKLKLEELRNK